MLYRRSCTGDRPDTLWNKRGEKAFHREHHDGQTRSGAVGAFKPVRENLSQRKWRLQQPPAEEQRHPSTAQVHWLRHTGDTGAQQGAHRGTKEPAGVVAGRGASDRRPIAAGPCRDGCGCRDGINRPWWNSVLLQSACVFRDGALGRTWCSAAAPLQIRGAAGHQSVCKLRCSLPLFSQLTVS